MKLWSRGLGRTELKMDCRYYTVKPDPDSDSIFIYGKITDPVNWEFRITIGPDDIPGMIKLFLCVSTIKLVLMNIYRYFIYLWNRKKYTAVMGPDLVQNVNSAYKQMMGAQSRTRRLSRCHSNLPR